MSSLGSEGGVLTPSNKRQLMLMDCCLMIATTMGLLVVLFRPSLLPARFMFDERFIQRLAQGVAEGDSSYTQVSAIYRILGFADAPLAAGIFSYLLACIPYLVVWIKFRHHGSRTAVVFAVVGILLSAVYMGTYSKEVFVVPVILAVLLITQSLLGTAFICAAIVAYASYFRSYWFLVLIFFIILSLLNRKLPSARRLFGACLGLVFLGSIIFSAAMGVPADHFRMSVNIYREGTVDASTLIPRFVEIWAPLDGPINNVLSFVFLQSPLPLLVKLTPYYLALFLLLSAGWIAVFRSIPSVEQLVDHHLKAQLTRLVLLCFAFVMTQAFFEPDFGSALRHLTPFIPLFVMLILCTNSTKFAEPKREGRNFLATEC